MTASEHQLQVREQRAFNLLGVLQVAAKQLSTEQLTTEQYQQWRGRQVQLRQHHTADFYTIQDFIDCFGSWERATALAGCGNSQFTQAGDLPALTQVIADYSPLMRMRPASTSRSKTQQA